jgi:hypothetical protein
MGLPLEEGEGESPNFEPVSVESAPPLAESAADVSGRSAEATPEADAKSLPA